MRAISLLEGNGADILENIIPPSFPIDLALNIRDTFKVALLYPSRIPVAYSAIVPATR